MRKRIVEVDGMEENTKIPYIVFESERARQEKGRKHERTLWFIVVVVLLLLLFGTNAAWINYESQFTDEETTEIRQRIDTTDGAAYVAGIGDVYYGDNSANDTEN